MLKKDSTSFFPREDCVAESVLCKLATCKMILERENPLRRDFNNFMKFLKKAGEKMEDFHYFQIQFAGSNELKFRERVYCYELYHQLRNILGDDFRYKLDGEVDKAGHSFYPKLGPKKPDLIVHVPRDMDLNLAVIEVKPVTVEKRIRQLTKDINTLKGFLKEGDYYRAIILLYGNGQDLPKKIVSRVKSLIRNHDKHNQILLLWHRGPGIKIKKVEI